MDAKLKIRTEWIWECSGGMTDDVVAAANAVIDLAPEDWDCTLTDHLAAQVAARLNDHGHARWDARSVASVLDSFAFAHADSTPTVAIRPADPDGQGSRLHRWHSMPPVSSHHDYWLAVTDVPCPCCEAGCVRWNEEEEGPDYRRCDGCGVHFLAKGTAHEPELLELFRAAK